MQIKEHIEQMVTEHIRGLCVNCRNEKQCMYHPASSTEVMFCELYSLDEAVNYDEDDSRTSQGLCGTCDNRGMCKLPDRFVGVWHCNEYK